MTNKTKISIATGIVGAGVLAGIIGYNALNPPMTEPLEAIEAPVEITEEELTKFNSLLIKYETGELSLQELYPFLKLLNKMKRATIQIQDIGEGDFILKVIEEIQ